MTNLRLDVKGVSTQDGRPSAAELVALAGNGAGVLSLRPNVEGGETERKR